MKIQVQQIVYEDRDEGRGLLEIKQDGKTIFSLGDGEPEDMTLGRDLNCAFSVQELLKEFYEYGKNGIEVEFLPSVNKNWDEM